MKMIFLGPPGAGKGTQAYFLSQEFGILHISTGELLRQEINEKTALGIEAKSYVEKGELVPDELVIEMLKHKLDNDECCLNGYILDGFPRTIAQAKALKEHGIFIDKVFYFSVSEKTVIDRIGGRLYCPKCKIFYHEKYNPPQEVGICDKCGGELIKRADDAPSAIKNRLRVYNEKTSPVIDYYKNENRLIVVDAEKDIDAVKQELIGLVHNNES